MKQSSVRDYFKSETLPEAVKQLNEYPGSIVILAGATDVFVEDNENVDALLDISKLGLSYIKEEEDLIRIGSCTTFAQIIKSSLLQKKFTALWEAAKHLADMTTRNMATIGGNICTAVPSGDSIPPAYVGDAVFVVCGVNGEREIKVGDFFTGPRKTTLQKGDILKEIKIAVPKGAYASAFEKIGRNSEDLSVANAAAWLAADNEGRVTDIKVAHGAVAPTVVRAHALEKEILGKKLSEINLDDVCLKVTEAIAPITNTRSTAEYRNEVSCVLAKKVILRAYENAVAQSKEVN